MLTESSFTDVMACSVLAGALVNLEILVFRLGMRKGQLSYTPHEKNSESIILGTLNVQAYDLYVSCVN